MAINRFHIDSRMYAWSIERAGMSVSEYADRPNSRIEDWMSGKTAPTYKQLEKFAASVCVPVGYLFLSEPPSEPMPIPMYRGNAKSSGFDLNVFDTVNEIKRRQEWVSDYISSNDIDHCRFSGVLHNTASVRENVSRMRSELSLGEMWASESKTTEDALRTLSEKIEDAGVFVFFNGVVGNNTRRPISVAECRGFSLADEFAPCIFVNNTDSKSAQMFTLAHELCHILRGESEGQTGSLADSEEESFCDKVAAEFLVPSSRLMEIWDNELPSPIRSAASVFKVSELVIARRAHDLGLLNDEDYRELFLTLRNRGASKKQGSGGDFYKTSVKRIGRMFACFVHNANRNRQLSNTEAYSLTGLYGSTYDKFMSSAL